MEIQFNKNMGWDKRDSRACILSHNISVDERGLITKQGFIENTNVDSLSDSDGNGSKVIATTKNFVYLQFGSDERTKIFRFIDGGIEYVDTIDKISSVDGNDWYDVAMSAGTYQILTYIQKDGTITVKVPTYTDYSKTGYVVQNVTRDFTKPMFLDVTDAGANGEVSYLQEVLGTTVNGVYDADLKTAVEQFQTAKGITVDGIVGPETRGKLNEKDFSVELQEADENGYVFFDGIDFYYFVNGKIMRQRRVKEGSGPTVPEIRLVFGDYGDIIIEKVLDYNGYLHIFYQDGYRTADIIWDKRDPDVFVKNIKMEDRKFMGAGVIENLLVVGTHENEQTNVIENIGRFVVSSFTGSGYRDNAKVKTGKVNELIRSVSNTINNKLYVSVKTDDSYNDYKDTEPDTWNSRVYEISLVNGLTITSVMDTKGVDVTGMQWSRWDNWIFTSTGTKAKGLTNTDTGGDFGESEFISTFRENQLKNHNDVRVSIVFDKFSDTEQAVKVYYRTSTRDNWEEIENVDRDKLLKITQDKEFTGEEPNGVLKQQDIEIYKSHEGDGEVIDEFREISIKFVITGRANIIRAYLSSNTKSSRLIKSTA